ncbi:MAG: hypothetical protein ACI840_001292 [Ulvibacter sp.]|jgi:hypothetical protein
MKKTAVAPSGAKTEVSSLKKVLAYHDSDIIESIQKDHGLSKEEAEILFRDTLIFLWVCGTNPKGNIAPTKALDKGWHTFVLWTKEYREFCLTHFGQMIHHSRRRKGDVSTGNPVANAFELARKAYGELSPNWAISTNSSDCSPDTGGGGDECTPDYD